MKKTMDLLKKTTYLFPKDLKKLINLKKIFKCNYYTDNACFFGGDDFYMTYTDMYTLVCEDKIAVQYIPGRTDRNNFT